jgi:hypothetical protein
MVFNATFNNISVISWRSALLVEETGGVLWIYNYLCNQCISPLTLWVRTPFGRVVLDTALCDKVCQWLATVRWFSPGTPPVSSTNKADRHDISIISENDLLQGNKYNIQCNWHQYRKKTRKRVLDLMINYILIIY